MILPVDDLVEALFSGVALTSTVAVRLAPKRFVSTDSPNSMLSTSSGPQHPHIHLLFPSLPPFSTIGASSPAMSLTSRLSNLFSSDPETPTPDAATPLRTAQLGFAGSEHEVHGPRQMTHPTASMEAAVSDVDFDDLRRQPYLNVRMPQRNVEVS
jgi:hypothetical protein